MPYLAKLCSQPNLEEKLKKAKRKQPTMLPFLARFKIEDRTRLEKLTKKMNEGKLAPYNSKWQA